MGGEVLPDLVWLESRVKMAQERHGLTLPNVDLTRHAGSSCAIRLLVTYPTIDERRQMVSPQRRRHATRTSTSACMWITGSPDRPSKYYFNSSCHLLTSMGLFLQGEGKQPTAP
jgi:hypothetical protein